MYAFIALKYMHLNFGFYALCMHLSLWGLFSILFMHLCMLCIKIYTWMHFMHYNVCI